MAISPKDEYPTQIDTSDPTGYPEGQAKNVGTDGDGTGTPLDKKWLSDLWGLLQSLLAATSTTPSGNPDKVGASQYLDAFKEFWDGDLFFKVFPYWISGGAPETYSLDVTTQDPIPTGVAFKPDGLAMYITGDSNNTIYQYTLTTEWDLSTASYASKSKDITAQDSVPNAIAFKPDGTKMYIAGAFQDRINEYILTTAWDVSTAGFNANFSISGQEGSVHGLAFKTDGTKMYIVGANNAVYQYSLSTAWLLSSASYDSVSFDVSSEVTAGRDVQFTPDGLKMFVLGSGGLYEYELKTAWDVSTGNYLGRSMDMAAFPAPGGAVFCSAGRRMYVASTNGGGTAGEVVEHYSNKVVRVC